MLMGEYRHNMDAKGRIAVPAKFREALGECFYVSRGLDGCLTLYPEAQWEKRVARINACAESQVKDIRRFVFATTEQVVVDKQGRILISPVLRDHAGLVKDVIVIGTGLTAEIWDTERWQQYNEKMSTAELHAEMTALQI